MAAAHIHTLHVRTTFSAKEGIAFGSPLQGYCCSWPPRFRHLMSRPQYAIKTPRMRRPPDRQQTSDQRPSYPQEYQSEEIEMAKISLLGCCICSPDQVLLFTSRYALFQSCLLLLSGSLHPVQFISGKNEKRRKLPESIVLSANFITSYSIDCSCSRLGAKLPWQAFSHTSNMFPSF